MTSGAPAPISGHNLLPHGLRAGSPPAQALRDRRPQRRGKKAGPPARMSLENVHASSYLGSELGLSQRTVNESAAVARDLTALLYAGEGRQAQGSCR